MKKPIIVFSLIMSIMFVPAITRAQTMEEMQAQYNTLLATLIQMLLQQVAALQQQLAQMQMQASPVSQGATSTTTLPQTSTQVVPPSTPITNAVPQPTQQNIILPAQGLTTYQSPQQVATITPTCSLTASIAGDNTASVVWTSQGLTSSTTGVLYSNYAGNSYGSYDAVDSSIPITGNETALKFATSFKAVFSGTTTCYATLVRPNIPLAITIQGSNTVPAGRITLGTTGNKLASFQFSRSEVPPSYGEQSPIDSLTLTDTVSPSNAAPLANVYLRVGTTMYGSMAVVKSSSTGYAYTIYPGVSLPPYNSRTVYVDIYGDAPMDSSQINANHTISIADANSIVVTSPLLLGPTVITVNNAIGNPQMVASSTAQ